MTQIEIKTSSRNVKRIVQRILDFHIDFKVVYAEETGYYIYTYCFELPQLLIMSGETDFDYEEVRA